MSKDDCEGAPPPANAATRSPLGRMAGVLERQRLWHLSPKKRWREQRQRARQQGSEDDDVANDMAGSDMGDAGASKGGEEDVAIVVGSMLFFLVLFWWGGGSFIINTNPTK